MWCRSSSDHIRPRLIRLLGMLGSSHNGEVANAGRMADRLVRDAGLTWQDVIASGPTQTLPPRDSLADALRDWPLRWRAVLQLCQASHVRLPDKDRRFLASIADYRQQPSQRQLEWLRNIADRVREEAVP
jgi:hypothetical protein